MTTAAIDNDILYKGAGYGLLIDLIEAIPAQPKNVGVLGAAKFVVTAKLLKSRLSAALPLLDEVLRHVQYLEPTVAETGYAAQLEYEAQRAGLNIDTGESLLCAIVVERTLLHLATGDKKAIKGIDSLLAARGEINKLAGKVICLEQLVLRLIRGSDASAVRSAICAQATLDRALAACFSCASPEIKADGWEEGLASYIRDVRADAPSILAP